MDIGSLLSGAPIIVSGHDLAQPEIKLQIEKHEQQQHKILDIGYWILGTCCKCENIPVSSLHCALETKSFSQSSSCMLASVILNVLKLEFFDFRRIHHGRMLFLLLSNSSRLKVIKRTFFSTATTINTRQ